MIIVWKKLEKKLNVRDQKKQLNNMIVGWNNIECKKKLLGREKHPWKLKVEELRMLLDSEQPGSICQQKKQVLADLLMPIDIRILGLMKLQNNNKLTEQLMPIDSMKVGPMKAHNNNNIGEQLMPIDSMKVGPMKAHNNDTNITE